MKKVLFTAFAVAVCFLLLFSLKSCTRTNSKVNVPQNLQPDDLARLKQWFQAEWQQGGASTAQTERVSVWDHDTAFIRNNYANLLPDWRFAKVRYEGDIKFTEVPANVKDSLQFKLGATDSAAFFDQLSDSVFGQMEQSKIFLLIKEAPGEDIYAEAVTFI